MMRLLALSITMTYSICFYIVFAKVYLTCSKKPAGRPSDRKNQRIGGGSKEKLAVKRQKRIDFTKMKEEQRTQAEENSPQRISVSKERGSVQQKLTSKETCSEERKFSVSKELEVVGSKEAREKPSQTGTVKNERDEHMGEYLSAGPDDRAFTLLMPVAPVQEKTEGKSMFGEVIDPLKENDKNQSSQQENVVEVEPFLGVPYLLNRRPKKEMNTEKNGNPAPALMT